MTCIAGITENGSAWLGADSARISGWDMITSTQPKIFTVGPYAIGLSGSPRMAQILQYAFAPPVPEPGADLDRVMCTAFIDALRAALKDAGHAKKNDERESAEGSVFLAAVAGRLFKVHSDYQVQERADGFDACGCGEDFALGSLHTTRNAPMSPRERLHAALSAATRFSAGVSRPFTFLDTSRPVL